MQIQYLVRFRRVPMQIPGGVPEGSGADSRLGSGGFRCRYSVRFRKVRVQMLCEVSEGSDVFNGISFFWAEGLK